MAAGSESVSPQAWLSSESAAPQPVKMGELSAALLQIQRQVQPSLSAGVEVVEYIEKLVTRLLGVLCQRKPRTVQDVIDQVLETFPNPIDKWAMQDAQQVLDAEDESGNRGLALLPADKVYPLLKEMLGYKLDPQVSLYIAAVLGYVAADIWKLAGIYVRNISQHEITIQDVKVAMAVDTVLTNLFFPRKNDDKQTRLSAPAVSKPVQQPSKLSYGNLVKRILLDEAQYIQELSLIVKVFRAPFADVLPTSKDLDAVFSNILDIHEFSVDFIGSLEDVVEMAETADMALIGACFEEMAEAAEFDVYERYIEDVTKPGLRDRLNALLRHEDVSAKLYGVASGFQDIVKYVLPTLLLAPILHLQHYFEMIRVLREVSPDAGDRTCLMQAAGLLHPLRHTVDQKMAVATSAVSDATRRPSELWHQDYRLEADRRDSRQLLAHLQNAIEDWDGEPIDQCCNDYVMEGVLMKRDDDKVTELYVFLLDGLIVFCKRRVLHESTSTLKAYLLKEKFSIRHMDVVDRENSEAEEFKYSFELRVQSTTVAILSARTVEEKSTWMAALLFLLSRSTLESALNSAMFSEDVRLQSPAFPHELATENSEKRLGLEKRKCCSDGASPVPAAVSASSSRGAEDAQNVATEDGRTSTVTTKGDNGGKRSRLFVRANEPGICGMSVQRFSHLLVRQLTL